MSNTSGVQGFAAFAKPDFASNSGSTTAAATLAAARASKAKKQAAATTAKQQQSKVKNNGGSTNNGTATSNTTTSPSPIYTGSDQRLTVLFRKIGQKRDPITKVRALEELTTVVYPPQHQNNNGIGNTNGNDNGADDKAIKPAADEQLSFTRPEKIAALSHLTYLHETKLGYDNNSSVRAASYKALTAARCHVPKAWNSLFPCSSSDNNEKGEGDGDDTLRMTVGMAWGASRGDPASEVSRNAGAFVTALLESASSSKATAAADAANDDDDDDTMTDAAKSSSSGLASANEIMKPGKALQRTICHYSKIILGCKRPSTLQEVIHPSSLSTPSGSGANNNVGGKGSKKNKQKKSNAASTTTSNAGGSGGATTTTTTTMSEVEREEMEERYERVILSVLAGLGHLLECCPEDSFSSDTGMYSNMVCFPEASSITRLSAGTSRGSFRRGAYECIMKMCQFAPSLVVVAASPSSPSPPSSFNSNNGVVIIALGTLLPNILTSEKDPNNFGGLFELILSYLAATTKIKNSNSKNSGGAWNEMDAASFTKSLNKVLRRACYGSAANTWGPTILPIVASLPAYPKKEEVVDGDNKMQVEEENKDPLPLLVVSSLVSTTYYIVGRPCASPIAKDNVDNVDNLLTLPSGLYFRLFDYTIHHAPYTINKNQQWEGRKSTASVTDTLSIVSAVTECVTFLMLRRPKQDSPVFSIPSWKTCGQLFLDTLSHYLTETSGTVGYGPVSSAVDELCSTLSRDLHKLDVASSSSMEEDDDTRGIAIVKSWLWGEKGLQHTLSLGTENDQKIIQKWGVLLKSLQSSSSSSETMSNLIPACKILFHSILDKATERKNKSCNTDEGGLLLSILCFCGVDNVFPLQSITGDEDGLSTSIERFCVNDLLRWILVHSSSSISKSSTINTDFEIFKLCMDSIQSSHRQKQIWETVLQELIKAYCDYTTMAVALTTLAGSKYGVDLVRCEVLDKFAVETSDYVMAEFRRSHDILRHQDESDDDESSPPVPKRRRGNLSLFLKICVGISKDCPQAGLLVSSSVVQHWIQLCCERNDIGSALEDNLILEDDSGANALLKTLLDLAYAKDNVISHDEKVKLIYESWLEGGKTWSECAVQFFEPAHINSEVNMGGLKEQVTSIASAALCDDIRSKPPADHALLELICQAWAKRASRLMDISATKGLELVGLSNIELWDRAILSGNDSNESEFLFLCLMYLLHSTNDEEHRRELLFKNSDTELFVHIQSCISTSKEPVLESFQSRTTRNNQLVETLAGSNGLPVSLLESSCRRSVELLSNLMENESLGDDGSMFQTLTSLSFLVSALYPSAFQNQHTPDECSLSDDVAAEEVKVGDDLWYEKGESRLRVKAKVVKIHTDDFPNLYFTIKEDGSSGERQTVASRLKRSPDSPVSREILPLDEDNVAQRDQLGRCILDKLVTPFLSVATSEDEVTRAKAEVAAECINIVISQCGLVSLGIGSVRYDIFQAVSSMERALSDVLSAPGPSLSSCTPTLRCLSLAMGWGGHALTSYGNVSVLKLDSTSSLDNLAKLYDDQSWIEAQMSDPVERFHMGALMWIATAVGGMSEGRTFRQVASMMHSISGILLQNDLSDLATNSLSTMNAISSLQNASVSCMDYSSIDNDDEKSLFSKLTGCFIKLRLDDSGLWIKKFSSIIQRQCRKAPAMMLPASNAFADDLCDCLFDPVKRWCAFQLLHLFTQDSEPLQQGDDVDIPPETEIQLSKWTDTLEEEETIELEEDVSVAAKWLPRHIMTFLQNVGNEVPFANSGHGTRAQLMGALLSWITSLEILDVGGSVDMRNRSHISSFIQKTGALGFIMNLASEEADLTISRSEDIFACTTLDGEKDFTIEKVATLAVFKAVESLPTLVKSWYNDDCPRFLRQKLSAFVETVVAPATLQRELVRIKGATSFDEMSVSGSCVSREIIATYQQDEVRANILIVYLCN